MILLNNLLLHGFRSRSQGGGGAAMSGSTVRLNVGGTTYRTTQATLTRYPASMLGAMFSDSTPKITEDDGSYFIDRDGTLFQYVLNFLRSPQLPQIEDVKLLSQLSIEADFFQIEPMIQAINEQKSQLRGVHPSPAKYGHFLEIRAFQGSPKHTYTIVCACTQILENFPLQHLLGDSIIIKRHEIEGNPHFTRLRIEGAFVRLRLVQYLQNEGWVLIESADEPKEVVFVIRERWFVQTLEKPCTDANLMT